MNYRINEPYYLHKEWQPIEKWTRTNIGKLYEMWSISSVIINNKKEFCYTFMDAQSVMWFYMVWI